MTPQLSHDAAARLRIQTSLDESLIVEASAGTGKTTALVGRIVEVLRQGKARIHEIAAVTFTNKAAGELKLRLREALDKARLQSDEGRIELEDALEHLEEASIGTIHSFCAQILRERPVEAGVDPAFEELNEQQANRLFQRSFRAWMEQRLSTTSPGLKRAFARLAHRDSWDNLPPMEQLQFAARKLIEWRDYPASWRRESFAREEEIRTLLNKVRELAAASSRPKRVNDALYKGLLPARLLVQSIDRPEAAGETPNYDMLEAQILKLGRDLRRDTRKGSGEYGGRVVREELVQSRDEVLVWIEDFRRRADADLAAILRDELSELVADYNERKRRQGKLDFVDLLICTRDLLRDNATVRAFLQQRYKRLFVDEFQDTDPLQVEILLALSDDNTPGKLFLVGDPKQSIYKFRRADIQLYQQVCEDLRAKGVGLVRLTHSFRSVPNIQHFVNAAFETEMTGNSHATYVPLEQHRDEIPGRPSVIALPVPRPYKSRLSKEAVNKSLPDAIAAFIAWMVQDSGWGYQARDIAVLFRRRTQAGQDLTREYARALEARGIEHLLAGSKSFHRREEVETMRVALTAIEWPEDELSVFATLKGSLFAIPDEALLLHKKTVGRLHPFFREGAASPIAEALEILAELHRLRNHRPFATTVNALLEATRAHAGFVLRPGGNQILANVARVADLARSYEMSQGVSFRGFVEELTTQAEKEEATEAPVLEEDSDGVRLLTVHAAKGLEFPVVILADLTANISAREPDQYVDTARGLCATRLLRCAPHELLDHEAEEAMRERAEGIRVAYVAATRAKDILVVPAVGDEPFPMDNWLSPLDKALYPARDRWRDATEAEGCPQFGQVSVLDRPRDYDGNPEASVKPGLITTQTGTHAVVWWDPKQLHLGAEADYGLRQAEMLKGDAGPSTAAYELWRTARAAAIHSGSRPTFEVTLASQTTAAPPGTPIPIETITTAKSLRPGGRRFGTLVHAAMREVPLDAAPAKVQQVVELQSRIYATPAEETRAAIQAVVLAVGHPLLEQARQSPRVHREYPFTVPLGDNQWMEGVIDLVFEEEGEWVVVDFKTDADLHGPKARYEQQLRWYAHALQVLTGKKARAVLFAI